MSSIKLLPSILLACLIGACATGPNYYANSPPIANDPKAIMSAKVCSDLPVDSYSQTNAGAGWVAGTAPAGMEPLSCNKKYKKPYYCADSASCGQLVYQDIPNNPKDLGKDWSFVVDLLGGSILACADQCNKFGWSRDHEHGLDCDFKSFSASKTAPLRVGFTAKVPSDGTSQQMCLYIKPDPAKPGPISIGQMGSAQLPRQ